jgi:monofunctional biosynthetic peptidoglycan transglycosylase
LRRIWRLLRRPILIAVTAIGCLIFVVNWVNPPITYYIWKEQKRLGNMDFSWIDFDEISPVMAQSAVAAEDANFCLHWGFDMAAIRTAIDDGGNRGASTLTQQTVKNIFLWPARSWSRKALEALLTPVVEIMWSKQRILEIYLNIAEFDIGVFGVEAAAQHYFGVQPKNLSPVQAAHLAAVLPSPKTRSASNPTSFVRARATAIADGAATIVKDGRSACFED